MIRVSNPLRNATYLDSRSITILRREFLRWLDGSFGKGEGFLVREHIMNDWILLMERNSGRAAADIVDNTEQPQVVLNTLFD